MCPFLALGINQASELSTKTQELIETEIEEKRKREKGKPREPSLSITFERRRRGNKDLEMIMTVEGVDVRRQFPVKS